MPGASVTEKSATGVPAENVVPALMGAAISRLRGELSP